MSNEILVPSLGESVTEATVSKWLKNEGEMVTSDEPLVELETDKVNLEVPCPSSGVLSEINVQEGETVQVGSLLGVIKEKSINTTNNIQTLKPKSTKAIKPKKQKKEIKKRDENELFTPEHEIKNEPLILKKEIRKNKNLDNEILILDNPLDEDSLSKNNKEKIHTLSPAVRKIVEEKKIDISNIQGSGKEGQLLKGDLIKVMGTIPEPSKRKISHGQEEKVKMTKLRITIAKRLKEAQNNAAMLTTFNEIDMHNIIEMRNSYKNDFQKTYSVKLGFMSFFVKSCIVALKNFPAINAEIITDEIIYKNYYNIGVAVGTEKGLVVPVLKNADELSFADIEKNIFLLSEKAKKGKITINDLQGGTFTISNGGIYGSMLSTPILNPPQSGILGMHNIVNRPVAINNSIVIRPIMYLALSYDHRIVDGKEAVSFLKCIKDCLEQPQRLFLDL